MEKLYGVVIFAAGVLVTIGTYIQKLLRLEKDVKTLSDFSSKLTTFTNELQTIKEQIKTFVDCEKVVKDNASALKERVSLVERTCLDREKHCGQDLVDIFTRVRELEEKTNSLKGEIIDGVVHIVNQSIANAILEVSKKKDKEK